MPQRELKRSSPVLEDSTSRTIRRVDVFLFLATELRNSRSDASWYSVRSYRDEKAFPIVRGHRLVEYLSLLKASLSGYGNFRRAQ
jgi:hypothetical protein